MLSALGRDDMVRKAYASAGYGVDAAGYVWGPLPEDLKIAVGAVLRSTFAEGERELRHLSDDQAICVGYAVRSPQTDYLPPAHWLARRIGRELARLRVERGAGQIGPDGKVIVHGARTGRGGAFRPDLRLGVAQPPRAVRLAAAAARGGGGGRDAHAPAWPLPDIEMNGAGMFVAGGPNGDNGLSGKKLVVDAYGPGVPIGGGAWSGKDFFKVDRLGGMAARRLALESLLASDADEALVTLTYLPGGDRPARVDLLLDGASVGSGRRAGGVRRAREPRAARPLQREGAELVELARWGHQRPGMPWELPKAKAGDIPVAA